MGQSPHDIEFHKATKTTIWVLQIILNEAETNGIIPKEIIRIIKSYIT